MNDETEHPMPEKPGNKKRLRRWIRFVWGSLPPLLFLLVLVWVAWQLMIAIESKNNILKGKKTGLHILEGMDLAAERIDEVIEVIQTADDAGSAHKKLMEKFNLSSQQAKAVILMPFESLTKLKQEQLKTQIRAIQKEIAENRYQPQQKKPDVNVVALELTPTLIQDRISLPGFVEPWVRLKVLSEVQGNIQTVKIEEGDAVKQGDIIAVLDSRDFENSYRSAKASYEAALATQNRLKALYQGKLSTRSDLDNAVALSQQYKSTMDNLWLNIERCTIRAPISGVINHLFIEKGEYIKSAAEVVEILQIDKVKVRVGIPESDVDAVRQLKTFEVRIDALGGKVFQAKKRFLSKTAHNMARLYSLELELDNPNDEILPDMFVRVAIIKKEVPEGIALPLYAVLSRDNDHIVYVVNDEQAHARKVKLGFQEGWRVLVENGLIPGEKVIVMGQRNVSDGQKVNVIRRVSKIEDINK